MLIRSLIRRISYKLFSLLPLPQLKPAAIDIDIVIMAIRKDLKILPLCIEGVRNCIPHNISAIYIISPEDAEIKKFCEESGLVFVNEGTVLGYTPKEMNIITGTHRLNRSGWLFQQLLKLSGKVGSNRLYLCIDSDHILLNPHTFVTPEGKTVFYQSSEYHQPYVANIKKLTRGKVSTSSLLSYVSHKMLFDKNLLQGLREEIAQSNNTTWDQAIIDNLDREEDAGFSEFELYGNYVKAANKHLRPWNQLLLGYNKIVSYSDLQKLYGSKYDSVTFPEWLSKQTV